MQRNYMRDTLHWLPVSELTAFNTIMLTCAATAGITPKYIMECCRDDTLLRQVGIFDVTLPHIDSHLLQKIGAKQNMPPTQSNSVRNYQALLDNRRGTSIVR